MSGHFIQRSLASVNLESFSSNAGADHPSNPNHRSLRARGVHRQVLPGEGGASGSSSSSLSSLSSPTDNQEPGGGADLTPQPQGGGVDQRVLAGSQEPSHERHMHKYGHVQSAAAMGGGGQVQSGGEWETSSMSHPGQPHGHGYTMHEAGQQWSTHEQRHDQQPAGQHVESSWQRYGEQPTVHPSWQRHEDQPAGQDSSWQRHGQPAGQGLTPSWQRHGDQPAGQGMGSSWQGQGQGEQLQAGRQDMQPCAQGQRSYGPGGDLTGQGSYAGGQSVRLYPQGQGEGPYREGQSAHHNPHHYNSSTYSTEIPASAAMNPHLPSSAMLRTPSYPPSYYPPPDHHQAPPPHGNPSLYHQSSNTHSFPYYQNHHAQNPAGHAPLRYDQQEVPLDAYGGSGLIAGGWGRHYSFSSCGDTSLGSAPTGISYREGSHEQMLSYQSSQPSSLGTISGHAYGGTQHANPVRFDAGLNVAPYNEDEGERCHSCPLSSYPQHHYDTGGQGAGGAQTQPPYRRQGSASSYVEEGSKLSRHSNLSQCSTADCLAGEMQRRLVITEDTPAGEDEKQPDVVDDTKHALLTMLDSDRIDILEQPKDLEVEAYQKAVFTCRARALDTATARQEGVRQQWYRGEETLEGEMSADLVFADVERKDIGLYYCVITHPDEESVKKCSYVAQLSIKTGK